MTKKITQKTAIVLFNLGGPDKLQSVKPFLFNLFNDKAIISLPQPFRFLLAKFISARRHKKAMKIYEQIGGKSPLLEISNHQAHSLEKELSFVGNFKVFVAMRYWKPFAHEVARDVVNYGATRVILLPLYPQFSTATTQSSFDDFAREFSKAQNYHNNIFVQKICCYPLEPEFITSHAKLINQTLLKLYRKKFDEFRFLFSAHGLPQKLIDQGDPYVMQIEKTSELVIENLAKLLPCAKENLDFKVCYQSKVGPLEWTGPNLEHEIRKCALDKKIPVVVPISFVSEHSETLVELDIDYKNFATQIGLQHYLRVPALNMDGHYIRALKEICLNAASSNENVFSGCNAHRICDAKFKKCGFKL